MIYSFSSLWLSHTLGVGFNFIMISPLLPSCLSLDVGYLFLALSNIFVVVGGGGWLHIS